MDRVCDAALNAWCIVDGSTSEEKTLLSMLENVFRYYFEYNDRKKQTFLSRLSTGMADIPIDPSYSADWNNFLDGLKTFVLNIKTLEYADLMSLSRLNAICPVMNLTMHFENIIVGNTWSWHARSTTLVIDEIGIRPCAIGHDFLELALFCIIETIVDICENALYTIKLKIRVTSVRASLVDSVFERVEMKIKNKNENSIITLTNEWDVEDIKLLKDKLETLISGHTLPTSDQLNSPVQMDAAVCERRKKIIYNMVTRSNPIHAYLRVAPDKSTIVPPVLRLAESDLVVYRNGVCLNPKE